jgi:hypothetical protein
MAEPEAAAPAIPAAPEAAAPSPAPATAAPAPTLADYNRQVWDGLEPGVREWYQGRGHTPDNFDLGEIAKQRREIERAFGKQRIVKPDSPDDAEGWASVWKDLGVPNDAKGYDFLKSDDPKEQADLDKVGEIFHKANLTPAQAKAVSEQLTEMYADQQNQNTESTADAEAKWAETVQKEEGDLRREWGGQYEHNNAAAGKAISVLGLEEAAIQRIAKDAGFAQTMKTLAAIGGAVDEATFRGMTGGAPVGATASRDTALARIAQLKADNEFQGRLQSPNPNTRGPALAEWDRLHKTAYDVGSAA